MTETTAAPMGVRDILRVRDYRYLFGGQVVSDIGDGITFLLVLLVINDLTGGSTIAIALMAIAEAVPAFTVGLVAGVYVDRWNRRSIMLAADLLRAGIVITFGDSCGCCAEPSRLVDQRRWPSNVMKNRRDM